MAKSYHSRLKSFANTTKFMILDTEKNVLILKMRKTTKNCKIKDYKNYFKTTKFLEKWKLQL